MGKRKLSWGMKLLIWAAFLLILGAVGCAVLYSYTGVYERTRPELAMDALMADMREDDWYRTIRETVPEDNTPFESNKALFDEYFESFLRGGTFSYTRALDSSAAQPRFAVYAGRHRAATVTLKAKAGTKSGFGRSEWEVERIEAFDFRTALTGLTLQIDAPNGYRLFVNGVAVPESYLTASDIPTPHLTELEQRFDTRAGYLRYTIPGLYGNVTVTGEDGAEIAPSGAIENGVCPYTVDIYGPYSFRVKAPADATVTVSGAVLTEADVDHVCKDIFAGLDDFTDGNAYTSLVYTGDHLYTKPEITVVDSNGREMAPLVGGDGSLCCLRGGDEVPDEIREAVNTFYSRYMDYASHSLNRAALGALLEIVVPQSDLYRYIRNSADAMYWASDTELSYDEFSIDHFDFISDRCFTCTVHYSASATSQSWYSESSYDTENGYQLVFVMYNQRWQAAAMVGLDG